MTGKTNDEKEMCGGTDTRRNEMRMGGMERKEGEGEDERAGMISGLIAQTAGQHPGIFNTFGVRIRPEDILIAES